MEPFNKLLEKTYYVSYYKKYYATDNEDKYHASIDVIIPVRCNGMSDCSHRRCYTYTSAYVPQFIIFHVFACNIFTVSCWTCCGVTMTFQATFVYLERYDASK